ncbi:MAG: DNA-binding response regulator [Opitutus sp.]|nr:DNA-binding response regulator [Opitutus sp.]
MHRALLIEDEAAARADLRARLAAHPEVEIVGEAATFQGARTLLAREDYDLVFLDIRLIGGNAFDLVPAVRPGARIVFATAYDHYALRAFQINALDYLLKPVEPARLADALHRLPPAVAGHDPAQGPEAGALRLDDVVYLRTNLRARFALVGEISVITANDNYTEILLADGAKIFLRKSLKAWEESLPLPHFMRVHRTQIVNLGRVTEYRRDSEERTLLFVAGSSEPVPASRYRWGDIRERLEKLRLGR